MAYIRFKTNSEPPTPPSGYVYHWYDDVAGVEKYKTPNGLVHTSLAATVAIGSTTTLPAGSPATVVNVGDESAAVLNFGVPQGVQGVQGIQGIKGDTGAGVASGGTAGQSLVKNSGTNYDTTWADRAEYLSAGPLVVPTYVDNGGGSFTANALDVALYDNATFQGVPKKYSLAPITETLTDQAMNYVVADYNGGSPILRVTTDVNEITESSIVPVLSVFRDGSYPLEVQNWDRLGRGLANKLHQSIVKTQRYRRQSGLTLAEYNNGGTYRYVTCGSGIIWVGAVRYDLLATDSRTDTSPDGIIYFARTGGSWVQSTVRQYNNTQYSDGTNTQTLNNNEYGVCWLYRGVEDPKHLYMVLGNGSYTLQQAIASQQPASLPAKITSHGLLVGRVIVQKNANTATQVDSAFETVFSQTAPSVHNDLAGLQGGTSGEYYHLTSAQASKATAIGTMQAITGEPSGFTDPANVVVSYDPAARTVTLTGNVAAYYRGEVIPALVSGYVSPAHDSANNNYFLWYNGSTILWTTSPWDFSAVPIAFVKKGAMTVCLRETHGLMQWQSHKEAHETIGTYLKPSGGGGDIAGYTPNSTTATNRRPTIAATTLCDEDLESTLDALSTNAYTWMYLSSANTTNMSVDNTEIISLSGNQPYYNQWNGSAWVQTLFGNNNYAKIFVVAIPTSTDTTTKKYRYAFIQPQTVSNALSDITALTPNTVSLGDFLSVIPEFTFIGEIVVQYTSSNWVIVSSAKITGTRFNQTATASSAPKKYMTAVLTRSTTAVPAATWLTNNGTAAPASNLLGFYVPLSNARIINISVQQTTTVNAAIIIQQHLNGATGTTISSFSTGAVKTYTAQTSIPVTTGYQLSAQINTAATSYPTVTLLIEGN